MHHTAAVVQRVLPATPDAVFDEWTDAEAMADWMCPRPARPTAIDLDVRPGGRLRIDMEENGLRFIVTGRYIELARPHRLQFTWSCSIWPDPTIESVVTVILEPHAVGETLMTIRHTLLPPALIERHQDGWSKVAAQFDDALRSR